MNDILNNTSMQFDLNELDDFKNQSKKFYEGYKKEINSEFYQKNKNYLLKKSKEYQKKNRIKLNERSKILRLKNLNNYFCHVCGRGYADNSHYKIHCQSKMHQNNMTKLKQWLI